MTVFETVFGYLGIELYAQSTSDILIAAGVALAVSLVIRILTGIVYYTGISALMLFAKPVEKKTDIKRTPLALINRSVAEYMACGETGAPLLAVGEIVSKNILKMNLIGINLKSLEKLCAALEIAALGIAAVAVIVSGETGWLLLIGGAYLVYKIILLFFDTGTLSEKLYYGLTTYINREIGKFYIPDDKAGLRIFKNEIHATLTEQASILQNAINNLNAGLSGAIKESYEAMGKSLDSESKKYDRLGEKLKQPVEGLSSLLAKLDSSAGLIKESSKALSDNIVLMDKRLEVITRALDKNSAAGIKILENSDSLFRELKNGLKSFSAAYLGLEAELNSIRNIQQTLDISLQKYELSLQETAGRVGDAMGSIVELRGREATDALNESIVQHIKQFQSDTSKLLEKMTALFEQSYEQNRSEIQTLLRIEGLVKK